MHVFILYFAFFYSFFLFIPPLVLAIVLFHVSLSASVSFSSTHYSSHSSSLSFFHFSSHTSSRSSSHSPSLPYLSNSFSPLSYRTSSLSWSFPSLVLVLIILSLSYPIILPHVQSVWSYYASPIPQQFRCLLFAKCMLC